MGEIIDTLDQSAVTGSGIGLNTRFIPLYSIKYAVYTALDTRFT